MNRVNKNALGALIFVWVLYLLLLVVTSFFGAFWGLATTVSVLALVVGGFVGWLKVNI